MKSFRWLAWILAAAASGAVAAQALSSHSTLVPLQLTSSDGVQRVQLPLAVLQASRSPGLTDLAVFNAQGERLPHAWMPARSTAQQREAVLPMFVWPEGTGTNTVASHGVQVRVDAHGAVVRIDAPRSATAAPTPRAWLLDTGEQRDGERLALLRLHWPAAAEGFSRHATLEGSDDLAQWQTVAEAPLLDLPSAGGARVLRHEVRLDRRAPRYLRLRLDAPLALQQVSAQWQTAQGELLDSADFVLQRAAEPGMVAWQVDLGAPLALRRLQLQLPHENLVLLVWLEQRDDRTSAWRSVGRHTLYRLRRDGWEVTPPPIELNAPAARHWRVRLDPQSPGLEVAQLRMQAQWPQVWAAFLHRAPPPLQLAIGRERAADTALPLATLLPGYQPGAEWQLPVATLGTPQAQVVAAPSLAERLRTAGPAEHRRWLLWAVLVAIVGVLAWLARGLLKDVQRPPAP